MKASDTKTFTGDLVSDANAQRFRNQATGTSPCLGTSEIQGRNRSRAVIDCAPVSQLKVADRSYPAPGPAFDPLTGKPIDKVTGKAYKYPEPSSPGLFTR
jgi:hypothetical protein